MWIDSLCVIQSEETSKLSWFHSITEMRQLYSNCFINIAAIYEETLNNGLNRTQDPQHVKLNVV